MKHLIALAASVALNLAVLGALNFSALQSAPHGEVTITQLPLDADVAAFANALVVPQGRAVL